MSTRRRAGRGGQGGHEPRPRIRTRELRALELSVAGWSQPQIAAELGITQPAVSRLLKRVESRLLHEFAETVERQKARQTLRLEHLYTEAMRAWAQSKAASTRHRHRTTEHQDGDGGTTVAEEVVEHEHGDPRYLDQARKALADHRKLWGLDAPKKVDIRASRNPYETMTEDDLRARLAQQSRLLTGQTIDTTATPAATETDAGTPATLPPEDPPDADS